MTGRADVLVVGGAMAGMRTAEALRRLKYDGRIVVVEAGNDLLYDRPALSKQILTAGADAASVMLRSAETVAAAGIDLLLGHRAAALDVAGRVVRLADGSTLRYGDLVIATGAVPRRLGDGGDRAGVHYLRTLDDALELRAAVEAADRVVVVGAGFIGSEVAAAAAGRSKDVTVVEPFAFPLSRVLGDVVGERLARWHESRGVRLALGRAVTGIEDDGAGGHAVLLDDGGRVAGDLVVVGIGAVPVTAWLDGSGLDVSDGVVCDEYCRASAGNVYAVGDVARWPNARFGESMRIEHWTNAVEQAGAVAWNIVRPEARRAYAPVPYVWSDQHGSRLQIVGRPGAADETRLVLDDPSGPRMVALYLRDGALSGAFALDAPQAAAAVRRSLAMGTSLDEVTASVGLLV